MHSRPDNIGKLSARVLIVCLKSAKAEVSDIITAQAARGWEDRKQIEILPINDNFRRYREENSAHICKAAPREAGARVVVLGKIEHLENFGEGRDSRSLNVCRSTIALREILPSILRQSGLDWKSDTVDRLGTYDHFSIGRPHVDKWLRQFERLGVSWIGDRLVRYLDFWPSARLILSLGLTKSELGNFDCVCVNRKRIGKSGDVLANLLKKHIRSLGVDMPVEDFYDTFANKDKLGNYKSILFIEDSLLTGTEMTNCFQALMGRQRPTGRDWNMPCLPYPATLRTKPIELRFPVSTSLGSLRFRQFLDCEDFKDIKLNCCPAGQIDVLTEAGRVALKESKFFDSEQGLTNCPVDAKSHIKLHAFEGKWGSKEKRNRAIQFCTSVGAQLWELYIQEMKWNWPQKKKDVCSLGMHGLGLGVGFAHSVPKASLPLFWMDGPVKWDGTTLDWMALFPNAAF